MTEKVLPSDFALAMTLLRLTRGWNQDQLAGASGITNSALSEYERGKKVPELKSVQKILAALGYSWAALERAERFMGELREMGRLEAVVGPEGDCTLVPAASGSAEPETRARARRVAALVGQAATGFTPSALRSSGRGAALISVGQGTLLPLSGWCRF
jgi:transcriptional regulator with XRE-family HTH domain